MAAGDGGGVLGLAALVPVAGQSHLMRKRGVPDVEMRLYSDRIELSYVWAPNILFPQQGAPRDQIREIYPILVKERIIRLHPLIRGPNHIWIAMKSRGR